MKIDLRIEAAEFGQKQRKDGLASGVADSDAKLTAPVVADVVELGGSLPLDVQYPLSRGLELDSGIGELQILLALKQFAAKLLLQSGYLVAQSLLRDVQPLL